MDNDKTSKFSENSNSTTSNEVCTSHRNRELNDLNFKWTTLFGKALIFVTLSSVLLVGIVINILQVLLSISIKLSNHPRWRSIHKNINGHLIYILFAPPISLLYCWSNISLNIRLADLDLIEVARGRVMGLIIPNHSYELDYMTCFVLADQLGNLGAYKSFSKDEIKYLPVLGWALWLSDIIFVKRNWEQDKLKIASQLDELFSYDQTLLGLFAEGTRWTPEKHKASIEFAESRGLKPLKHHLIPRSRGFVYTIRHYLRQIVFHGRMDEKLFRIFNMQIVMPEKLNFENFIEGRQLKADVYCEEIILSAEIRDEVLKSKDENDCPKLSQLIQDIYQRKDQLVDEYRSNGNKFLVPEGGGEFPFKRRKLPIFITILSYCYTFLIFSYLIVTGSYIFWSLLAGFITCCAIVQQKIDQESRLKQITAPLGESTFEKTKPKLNPDCYNNGENKLDDDKLNIRKQLIGEQFNKSSPAC